MSPLPPLRPDLVALAGYHSPQVDAAVRLNTNESPFPPPETWRQDLENGLEHVEFNRYPDRRATALREALARSYGVGADEVFCANGSDEVLQCLLLAFGGPGRRALVFEPTYKLHSHIARVTGTEVVVAERGPDFTIDPDAAVAALDAVQPAVVFLCSPNNPTGRSEPAALVRRVVEAAPGLVVLDEAYGQFAPRSALGLREDPALDTSGLVVVRTFSKTWAMAASRLGYLLADPGVVAGCEVVALPYHLSAPTQLAGLTALRYQAEMESRVAVVAEERGRLAAALAALPVETWPSDANFILFRPQRREAKEVWQALLDRGVLIRDCSGWDRLEGCLRVTVGTPRENDLFLGALEESL
ncbi:MAG TPA: histidinol-phosphate transaminase [Acidimicrobiales bacterium]|nr:histidinol-phosphate transaminase [Acidimicrobiales bacterium]